ncbi:MAG TPA: FliM/FliN family flagellar motor C-terminal domain-containing protein [Terriglobales bacterium]|nr:FliM/FliN family flagellar motor C-terminal domain-containing protein [Terriglobales bacterium]
MDAAVQRAKESQPAEPAGIAKDPVEEFGWLSCHLSVEIPVSRFTVRDLLNLRKGAIVETACHHAIDVPLRANGLLIAWTEFEVIGTELTVRITELA